MKLIITGGLGYIGSHIIHNLQNSNIMDKIIVIDDLSNSYIDTYNYLKSIVKTKIMLLQMNISDITKDVLEELHIGNNDILLHMASSKYVEESIKDPLLYYDNNISSFVRFLRNLENVGCKNIIFSSSATVYGNCDYEVNENTPLVQIRDLNNPYGKTKSISEVILHDLHRYNKWDVCMLRYFNPVGYKNAKIYNLLNSNEDPSLFSCIIDSYKTKKTFNIFGGDYKTPDGTPIRDFVYVDDLALAHIEFIKRKISDVPKLKIYNIGTGKQTSVKQVIDSINSNLKNPIKYKISDRRPGDAGISHASIEKILAETNWKPNSDVNSICKNVCDYLEDI